MDEEEQFRQIPEFMMYAVSNYGRVINLKSGREMTYSPTQYGDLTVGMMKNGKQWRRSVKVLVAKAWVPGESLIFDTVINKDSDRRNNHYTNLAWRPRWFAWKYHHQFYAPPTWAHHGPVMCVETQYVYDSIGAVAVEEGVMMDDVRKSITFGTRVFPTGHTYKFG